MPLKKSKKYAKKKGISVSKLSEDHISSITENVLKAKADPLETVRRLKGIAKNISRTTNSKDLITLAIIEKHLK